MVLRTSIIGEEKGQSRSLVEWVKSQAGKQVNGFTNHRWNGMTAPYLTEVIETIWQNNLYRPGIFHLYSAPIVNKFELLTILNEVYGLNLKINPTETPTPCDRSLGSMFDLSRKVVTKPLHCQIQEMRDFFSLL
jgi:dTDP-4-dehydrorhamnose reductase